MHFSEYLSVIIRPPQIRMIMHAVYSDTKHLLVFWMPLANKFITEALVLEIGNLERGLNLRQANG